MDVEHIQKINRLAEELLNKGMSSSRDEAVRHAEQMLNRDGDMELSNINKKTDIEAQHDVPKEQVNVRGMDEIRNAMRVNTEFLVKQLKEFKQRVSDIETQLELVKNQARQPVQMESVQTQRSQPVSEPSKEVHPKRGNFTESEVSIDKMFYMGNKKF